MDVQQTDRSVKARIDSPSPEWWSLRPLLVAVLLAALTVAALGAVVTHDFISLDDGDYIYRNSMVKGGLTLRGVWTAFSTTRHTAIWHPLSWISHMVDVQLFGMRPGAHHAVNLAIHVANVLLLFLLLRSLTGALWRSAFVAALYAVHPLHVESVAWAAERKDVLSSFFALLTAHAYQRAARRNLVARSAAVPFLFALALLSKAMVVTLPFVFLLLDWWPLGRWAPSMQRGGLALLPPARLWLEKKLLFAFAAGSAAVTYYAQSAGATVSSAEALPLTMRLANVMVSYTRYLANALWPHDLSIFYTYPEKGLPLPTVAAAVAVLAAVTLPSVRRAATRPYLAVGLFWFLGTLVPVVGFVQTGGQAMADRYTYFTLTGVLVAVTWAAWDGVARFHRRAAATAALALAVVAALTLACRQQAALWKGDLPLFSHALRIDPNNWAALNVLGNNLLAAGRMTEAGERYQRAMSLHANHFDATHNYGLALAAQGRREEALGYLQKAIEIRPDFHVPRLTLGRTLLDLGRPGEAIGPLRKAVELDPYVAESRATLATALAATGQIPEALESFDVAFRLEPDNALAHLNFGLFLLSQGRLDEAGSHFKRLLELNPNVLEFPLRIGAAYQAIGRREEALAHLMKTLELAPGLFEVHRRIGEILFEQGRLDEAAERFRTAAKLNPSDLASWNNLGVALAQRGKLDEAAAAFRRALVLNPAAVDAHLNLGLALLDRGHLEEAAAELLEAYELDPADARMGSVLQRLVNAPGGAEAYERAARRRPRPKGLPTIPLHQARRPTEPG